MSSRKAVAGFVLIFSLFMMTVGLFGLMNKPKPPGSETILWLIGLFGFLICGVSFSMTSHTYMGWGAIASFGLCITGIGLMHTD